MTSKDYEILRKAIQNMQESMIYSIEKYTKETNEIIEVLSTNKETND